MRATDRLARESREEQYLGTEEQSKSESDSKGERQGQRQNAVNSSVCVVFGDMRSTEQRINTAE